MNIKNAVATLAVALAIASPALADCGANASVLAVAQTARAAVVRIQTLSNTPGCELKGNGFLISPDGYVLTAKHVVPDGCEDRAIRGRTMDQTASFELERVKISALDVALLRIINPTRQYPTLSLIRPVTKPGAYRDKTVAITSYNDVQSEPVTTLGVITGVVLPGDPQRWAICGAAANPGRSGSPVMTADGSALAVFVDRPAGDQDIARIIPVSMIADIAFDTEPPVIRSRAKPGPALRATEDSEDMLVELNVMQPQQNLLSKAASALLPQRAPLAPGQQVTEINAPPGWRFENGGDQTSGLNRGLNSAALPEAVCATAEQTDCFKLEADGRKLVLRGDAEALAAPASMIARVSPSN